VGASFANVHVRVLGAGAQKRVMAALRSLLVTPGIREVDAEADADRTIVLAPSGSWVAVYDELSDELAGDDLATLAKGLSGALDAPAVTVLVADSDVLLMELFEHGKRVAEFDSNPAISGRRRTKLKLDKWRAHLAPGHDSDELAEVFADQKLFAERTLENAAALLGMDAQRACLGYRYQQIQDAATSSGGEQANLVFRLRKAQRPAHESAGTAPSRFVPCSCSTDHVFDAGQDFRAGFAVRNEQRASRGLSIVMRGPALERGLVRLRHAQLVVGDVRKQKVFPEAAFVERPTADSERIWVAEFPELEIPAGAPSASFLGELIPSAAGFSAMQRAQIHTNIHGDAVGAGTAEFQIGFVPHDARETGQSGFSSSVEVRPQARKPLRAAAGHSYGELQQRTVLFGLVSCSGESRAMATLAAELADQWLRALPRYSESAKCRFHVCLADREAGLISGSGKAEELFRGKRLRSWLDEPSLVDEVTIELENPRPAGQSFHRSNDGFIFSSEHSRYRSADLSDTKCPTFCFWMYTHGHSEDTVKAAEQALTGLVSQVFAREQGIQGLIGQWGRQPRPDSTLYESVCKVHGQCTLQHSWLTRFMRGVTSDTAWLGPELLARIDRRALDRVAALEETKGGVRFRLRPEATLDELEEVVAELLPSEADWRAGIDRFDGRAEMAPSNR
jgi:hypothetical protein